MRHAFHDYYTADPVLCRVLLILVGLATYAGILAIA